VVVGREEALREDEPAARVRALRRAGQRRLLHGTEVLRAKQLARRLAAGARPGHKQEDERDHLVLTLAAFEYADRAAPFAARTR
jgi:hypothetical protein